MIKVQISLLFWGVVCCLMMAPASAIFHVVGGSLGWTIPPNKTYYEEWAKPRIFGVEDKLIFPFRGFHTVMEVSAEDFDKCTQENPTKTYPFGPVIMNFTEPGDHYYYSSVGTQCEAGQKLHITVVSGKGSSGRIHLTVDIGTATPSPAPKQDSAAPGPIVGLGMVIGSLISFGAWIFV